MRFKNFKFFLVFVILGFLSGCDGGGGGSPPDTGSSNWDEMVWDQDNWA